MRSETTIAEFCQEYLRARNIEPTPPPPDRLPPVPPGFPKVECVERAARKGPRRGVSKYQIQLRPDEAPAVFEGYGRTPSHRRTDAIAKARAARNAARNLTPGKARQTALSALLEQHTDDEIDGFAEEEEVADTLQAEIEARLAARDGRKKSRPREDKPLAETTARAYRSYAAILSDVIGTVRVCDLTSAHVAAVHDALGNTEGKPTLANRVRVFLGLVCKYAEIKGLRPAGTNPVPAVRPHPEVERKDYIPEDKREAFDEKARELVRTGAIAWGPGFLLLLMFWTGVRWSDATLLRWSEVKLDGTRKEPEAHLLIKERNPERPRSKGGRRVIPLCPEAVELFRDLPRPAEGDGWVVANPVTGMPYTDIRASRRKVCDAVGIEDKGNHIYRHTVGEACGAAGLSVAETARVLGHNDLDSSKRYVKVGGAAAKRSAARMSSYLVRRGGHVEGRQERGILAPDGAPGGAAGDGARRGAAPEPSPAARHHTPPRAGAPAHRDSGDLAHSASRGGRSVEQGVSLDALVADLSPREAAALMARLAAKLTAPPCG